MIYLDNSASTITKPKNVQRAVYNALNTYSANPGRSGHKQAIKTAMQVENVRSLIAKHLNTSSDKVVFTLNCSDALNLAILGSYKQGGNVVCTVNEHNSVLRPLQHLKDIDETFSFTIADQSNKYGISWKDIENNLSENTYMVVCNHISNVNGDMAEIEEIGKHLYEKGILFLVDGAQGGGHFHYDMEKQHINMLSLAPHKGFYAPQGVGCLAMNGTFELSPIRFGGTGTNSLELHQPETTPERFETGTLNTPAILGFGEGIKFVEENFSAIQEKLEDLTTYLHYELSKLPVNIYTNIENSCGVFAFNVEDINSTEIANYLDEKWGICVRSGYHCAPLKHKSLDTLDNGIVRVSMSFFNTYQEIEKFVFAIKSFLKLKK
ncbi:MAG: aminotransferase class V-fold PLP-dependent enzyme [Clostridiales bacterium]|nr:aminotransferase class V-fold PLP-dependent enzyme [Clostridiales bacterium]